MCIIVSKEKGQNLPTKKTLETCFNYNDDGAGFMYVRNGKVVIDKGYMTFDSFYKRLKELKKEFDIKEKALVMHFRIGTSGTGKENLTHPFPLTCNKKKLNKTYLTTDVGVMHNGIIKDYEYDKVLSDTQTFIKDFMYPIYEISHKFYKSPSLQKILEKECGSKLCILDSDENIYYIGDFVEDEGIKYSNTTYKTSIYKYYDDYDWYYRDYYWQEYIKGRNKKYATSKNDLLEEEWI